MSLDPINLVKRSQVGGWGQQVAEEQFGQLAPRMITPSSTPLSMKEDMAPEDDVSRRPHYIPPQPPKIFQSSSFRFDPSFNSASYSIGEHAGQPIMNQKRPHPESPMQSSGFKRPRPDFLQMNRTIPDHCMDLRLPPLRTQDNNLPHRTDSYRTTLYEPDYSIHVPVNRLPSLASFLPTPVIEELNNGWVNHIPLSALTRKACALPNSSMWGQVAISQRGLIEIKPGILNAALERSITLDDFLFASKVFVASLQAHLIPVGYTKPRSALALSIADLFERMYKMITSLPDFSEQTFPVYREYVIFMTRHYLAHRADNVRLDILDKDVLSDIQMHFLVHQQPNQSATT
ncbi:hypothetical protein C8J56DRAFT_1031248 [Mycena floridula]|nr:hypothetical protein C8J56DRAFT_1031248 [Mycena floridula]